MSETDHGRQAPAQDDTLIGAYPIDGLVRAFRDWATTDRGYARQLAAIDKEVATLRRSLKAAGLAPAERPFREPAGDAAQAPGMVKAARSLLAQAETAREAARNELAQARAAAATAQAEAQAEAEAALAQGQDVVLARRVVGVLAVLLAALFVKVVILG